VFWITVLLTFCTIRSTNYKHLLVCEIKFHTRIDTVTTRIRVLFGAFCRSKHKNIYENARARELRSVIHWFAFSDFYRLHILTTKRARTSKQVNGISKNASDEVPFRFVPFGGTVWKDRSNSNTRKSVFWKKIKKYVRTSL